MRQRTLLIISHMPTFFSEQLPYIRLCLESGRFKPVVQFAVAEAYVLPQIATCLSLGIEVYNTDGVRITEAPGAAGENIQAELPVTIEDTGKYPSTSAALLTACRKRVAYRMRRTADKVLRLSCRVFRCPERMINPMPKWRSLRHRGKVTRRLLRETRPDLVLLGGDLAHHDTSAAIAEARKAGIPALVLTPILAGGIDPAWTLASMPEHQVRHPFNRLCAALFPEWVYVFDGAPLLRLPASELLLMKALRLAPPRPWVFNSGFADAVLVDGRAARDYYLKAGLCPDSLRVVGSPVHDELRERLERKDALRRETARAYGLSDDKRLLVCALPPDIYYMVPEEHRKFFAYPGYDSLMSDWLGLLGDLSGWNVLVCVHPSVTPEVYAEYETPGLRFFRGGTFEVVPLCSLFVACVSSTIRWPIMCGIPVLNFDAYNIRYDGFVTVRGVLLARTRKEFAAALARLTEDDAYLEEVAGFQREEAPRWAALDGLAGERILRLFDELSAGDGSRRPQAPHQSGRDRPY